MKGSLPCRIHPFAWEDPYPVRPRTPLLLDRYRPGRTVSQPAMRGSCQLIVLQDEDRRKIKYLVGGETIFGEEFCCVDNSVFWRISWFTKKERPGCSISTCRQSGGQVDLLAAPSVITMIIFFLIPAEPRVNFLLYSTKSVSSTSPVGVCVAVRGI